MAKAVCLDEPAHSSVYLETDGLIEDRRVTDREHESITRQAHDHEAYVHPPFQFDVAQTKDALRNEKRRKHPPI